LFKTSLKISPLFIAIAATIPSLGQAAEATKADGFVEGSSLKLNARNYYMNRNRQQQANDNIEWGQGFLGIFESGYTRGTVGFGVDANAMLGLKPRRRRRYWRTRAFCPSADGSPTAHRAG